MACWFTISDLPNFATCRYVIITKLTLRALCIVVWPSPCLHFAARGEVGTATECRRVRCRWPIGTVGGGRGERQRRRPGRQPWWRRHQSRWRHCQPRWCYWQPRWRRHQPRWHHRQPRWRRRQPRWRRRQPRWRRRQPRWRRRQPRWRRRQPRWRHRQPRWRHRQPRWRRRQPRWRLRQPRVRRLRAVNADTRCAIDPAPVRHAPPPPPPVGGKPVERPVVRERQPGVRAVTPPRAGVTRT